MATARGVALSEDDRMRAYVIERLMCDLAFSADDLSQRYGEAANELNETAEHLIDEDRDGLVTRTPDGFRVTERGGHSCAPSAPASTPISIPRRPGTPRVSEADDIPSPQRLRSHGFAMTGV